MSDDKLFLKNIMELKKNKTVHECVFFITL